jgi:hypothetical protein
VLLLLLLCLLRRLLLVLGLLSVPVLLLVDACGGLVSACACKQHPRKTEGASVNTLPCGGGLHSSRQGTLNNAPSALIQSPCHAQASAALRHTHATVTLSGHFWKELLPVLCNIFVICIARGACGRTRTSSVAVKYEYQFLSTYHGH